MITAQSSSLLVFVSAILSVESSIDGSIKSCPRNDIVNLTGVTSGRSEFVEKEGIILPLNLTWHRDGEWPSFKTCLSLCCSPGTACVKDNNTSGILHQVIRFIHDNGVKTNFSARNFHTFANDPCEIDWMASSEIINFTIFENGSIYAPDYKGGSVSNFEQYCLIRQRRSSVYVAKICRPWIKKNYFEICCLVLGIFIMLAIFMGYTIVPGLRNLHGLIFRSYVATYIATYVFSLGVLYTTELRINPFWFSFFENTTRYFGASCTLWLNAMSVNIWRSFQDLRPIRYDSEEEQRRKYMWYAIYAWFSPVVLFVLAAAFMKHEHYFSTDIGRKSFKLWGCVVLVTVALICNIFLHTLTALNIRRHKRDTAYLFSRVNPHYEIDKRWFKLHFKLFMITGGHTVWWVIWLIWSTPFTTHFLGMTEVVQSSLIFAIFVGNRDFKQSLHDRFASLRGIGAGQT